MTEAPANRVTVTQGVIGNRGASGWEWFSALALCAIFCLNVYRAATQSITIDEAQTWNDFASQPLAGYLLPYDTNSHLLNTFLIHLSTLMFGASELTVRLPCLLAGGLYLAAAWRISRLLFGAGVWAAATALLLATDPAVLDYLSAARGYGAELAFWLAAVCILARLLDEGKVEDNSPRLLAAGVLCGLAILSQLTGVFPVTAVAIAFLLVGGAGWSAFWKQFAVPAALIPGIVLTIPVSRYAPNVASYGLKSLHDAIDILASVSFEWAPIRSAAWPAALILIAGAAACAVWQLRAGWADRRLGFFSLIPVVLFGLGVGGRYTLGLLYPIARTGIYIVPIAILAASSISYRFRRFLTVRGGAAMGASLCLLAFLLQLRTSYYGEWPFDAGTKPIAQFIGSHYSGEKPLTIRTEWRLAESLEFYRRLHHWNWNPVDRTPLDGAPGDIYVVARGTDPNLIAKLHLRPVFTEPRTGHIVALPNQ